MEPFKNFLNLALAQRLENIMLDVYPAFDGLAYREVYRDQLEKLELKERALLLAEALRAGLPASDDEAAQILADAVKSQPPLTEGDKLDRWHFFPINQYLARYGLRTYERSMDLLKEVTMRFTAEFAIRPFLIERPEETLERLKHWTADANVHVRRLVSEGTRPRLPWAPQLPDFIRDPSPILPLLEALRDDPEEYVRRSVANNLNDIAKDHPERLVDLAEAWLDGASRQRSQLIKRACRTLVKQGHPRCLAILGFAPCKIELATFALSPSAITLGEKLELQAILSSRSSAPQKLVVDYRFHFVKANGKTAPKVFKGSTLELPPGGTRQLSQVFHLKPITTRKYYAGETTVEIVINGQAAGSASFRLET